MKKISIIILISIISFFAKAQLDSDLSFIVNPQAGINFSHLRGDADTKGKAGIQTGVNFQFGKRTYIQPGIFYISRAFELQDDVLFFDVEDKLTLKGWHIPVLLGYRLINEDEFNFRVNAGPELTFLSDVKRNDFDLEEDDFARTLFGLKLGAGVDISYLTFDINYIVGFNDLFDNQLDEKNNVLSFNVGLRWGF